MATDEIRQQLDKAVDLFMKYHSEGDFELLAKSIYRQDCVLMPPDGTIAHYSDVKDVYGKSDIKRYTCVNDESVIEGNMAVTRGHYTGYREDGNVAGSGRYTVMFLPTDGKWLMKYVIWTGGQ